MLKESYLMDDIKSLDNGYSVIAALLHDVQRVHGDIYGIQSLRLDLRKIHRRLFAEGLGFLTKTLPRLGKAFDKALADETKLNSMEVGFSSQPDSKLPLFCGKLFNQVLSPSGELLPQPCAASVKSLRQILYIFYKYELPYTDEQERQVISKFAKTETDMSTLSNTLRQLGEAVNNCNCNRRMHPAYAGDSLIAVIREAKIALSDLFAHFDPQDIRPRHGPGAVATKQKLEGKYVWSNVSARITDLYPFDAYFCASAGHVCDSYRDFSQVGDESLSARVVLVNKDSRGPRLISCEPVDYQWVQQGVAKAVVKLVESHENTMFSVHFTDQGPNRRAAELASVPGRQSFYGVPELSTLDLNEASDRVSLELVRLLFPPHIVRVLEACRSLSTVLPDGRTLVLQKFAPMGSSLCFPILALSIWAVLYSAMPDAQAKECLLVYGDDVVVPTAHAEYAMSILESLGLKINRDKSCTKGLFRESCGMDAFNGVCVTPVRLRTVWELSPAADVYTSWIAYANEFYDRQYYVTYNLIVEQLLAQYGPIPDESMHLACPSLREVPLCLLPKRSRSNKRLQKREYLVWDVTAPTVSRKLPGWSMLLRYFAESSDTWIDNPSEDSNINVWKPLEATDAVRVEEYTDRRSSILVRRWR